MTPPAVDLSHATAVILTGRGAQPRQAPAQAGRRPFVTHVLDRLASTGVPDVIVCSAEGSKDIRAALGDVYKALRLSYLHHSGALGTAAVLRLALPRCSSDPVLVLNGDSVCRVDLRAVWRWHFTRSADATIVLSRTSDTRRWGRVLVGRSFRIFGFQDKPETTSPGWINAGVYVLARRLLEAIPADATSLEHEVLPSWIPQSLHGFPTAAPFVDVGGSETHAGAEQLGGKEAGPAT
jgi:NDP-sugar pyrophosphorylase family protein